MNIKRLLTVCLILVMSILFTGCATTKSATSAEGNIHMELLTVTDGLDQSVTGVLTKIKEVDEFNKPTGRTITKWQQYNKEAFGGRAAQAFITGATVAGGQVGAASLISRGIRGKKACGDGANCGTIISNNPLAQSISESVNDTGIGLGSGQILWAE